MSAAKQAVRQEQKQLTAEDLWVLPEQPGVRYELAKGELIGVPGAGALHNLIAALVYRLVFAVAQRENLGLVFTDGVGYILRRDPDVVRIPDVSFVAHQNIPQAGIPDGFWPGTPDLAVEIVSPNDLAQEVDDKVHEYLDAGVRQVWVLWPKRRAVTVYLPGAQVRELGPDDALDGGDVLPGFSTRAATLFEVGQ